MSTIKVEVLRPFLACGEHCGPAGRIVKLAPGDALLVLESGRGKLADPTDLKQLAEHRQAEVKAALKAAGPVPRLDVPETPWRRI